MPKDTLAEQNIYLRKMLEQAGLDADARDVAEKIQRILTNEIHHRMKNMLAMVTAVVRQSIRTANNLPEAEAAIATRLIAMAKAHDLLLKADWKSAGLTSVIAGAIEQHNTESGRILIEGDEMEISSTAILPLTLMLNELCTNATKYGALSNRAGRVKVISTRNVKDKSLAIRWLEIDGPPVNPPALKSFGTRLIEEALPRQLGGIGQLSFPQSGAEFKLDVPLENVIAAAEE